MKKLIFILFAFLAISTTAQTIPSYPTIKLTKLATGGGDEDVLVLGADKRVKKADRSTFETAINAGTTAQYWRGDKSWQTLNKAAVGLSNVDNTTDAAKPVSTATQTALNAKQNTLVSGTSIKTINGNSLLGSGDIVVSSDGSTIYNENDCVVDTNLVGYFKMTAIKKGRELILNIMISLKATAPASGGTYTDLITMPAGIVFSNGYNVIIGQQWQTNNEVSTLVLKDNKIKYFSINQPSLIYATAHFNTTVIIN